jgi:hypothetical protein
MGNGNFTVWELQAELDDALVGHEGLTTRKSMKRGDL